MLPCRSLSVSRMPRRNGRQALLTISEDREAPMSICSVTKGSARPPKQVTGRIVFSCFASFFAVVAAVNAVMVWAAVRTFGGVETESSYQAGLAFAREAA